MVFNIGGQLLRRNLEAILFLGEHWVQGVETVGAAASSSPLQLVAKALAGGPGRSNQSVSRRDQFGLYISQTVLDEVTRGDIDCIPFDDLRKRLTAFWNPASLQPQDSGRQAIAAWLRDSSKRWEPGLSGIWSQPSSDPGFSLPQLPTRNYAYQ
ncbi:MAG: hypothetical protein AAFN08_09450 [Cyanobacteria bacterium J06559_3]